MLIADRRLIVIARIAYAAKITADVVLRATIKKYIQPGAATAASTPPNTAPKNGATATTRALKGGFGTSGKPGSCTATGVALLRNSRIVGSDKIARMARPVALQIHSAASGLRAK